MIKKIIIGNILDSNSQTLINTVNCVGIMGKGIALEFKKKFPKMFKEYKTKCEKNLVKLGEPYIYGELFGPQIINFPTKQHWRSISKIKDIEKGMIYLINHIADWNVKSLAVPPLGCGNGQLDWKDVGPLIYKYLNKLNIPIEMYAPVGTPKNMLSNEFLKNPTNNYINSSREDYSLNSLWLVLVEIVDTISKQQYHIPIGRTMFQKIGYVATTQGLPAYLDYKQGSYGPFSNKLKKVITILSNNGILIEENKGSLFELKVGSNYYKFKNKYSKVLHRFSDIIDNTSDLFSRLYTTQQSEIVATIIYTYNELLNSKNSNQLSEHEIFSSIMKWKRKRRPPLDESQVASAIRNLAIMKWIKVNYSKNIPIKDEFVY